MILHKNKVWLCFLSIIFLITCAYTGKTLYKLYDYMSLSSLTHSKSIEWSVNAETEDLYLPAARYAFEAKGKVYEGEMLFSQEAYRNPWAAEESLKNLAATYHSVWFSPSDPAHSSLQKKFPLKESIYAGVLWALSVYFFWLGAYVAKVHPN